MGKAQKKKRTQAWRHNPIRVPDAHLPAGKGEGQADPSKEKQMLPVFNKLKSGEYADRTWACSAICNLIQNDPATRRLFQSKNVVGELIERLSDSVDEVVVEASGALRNLAIDGGHELCAEMFNKGLMAHLVVLIQKISTTIDSVFATTKETQLSDEALQARKHLLGLTENVLSLVWSMAETSHKALEAVNAAGVEELLVKVLDGRDVLGISVALAAAQALYSLSQDNWPVKKKMLNEPAALEVLAKVVQNQPGSKAAPADEKSKGKGKKEDKSKEEETDASNLTRLLVCGALRNIVDSGSSADQYVSVDRLTNEFALAFVDELLSLDTQRAVSRVFELVNEASTQAVALAGQELKTDHRTPAEAELDTIERKLNTVVIGLEVLTGICAGIQDVDSPEEQDGAESDEEDAGGEEGMVDDEEMEEDLPDEDLIALARGTNSDGDEDQELEAGPTVHMPVTSSQLLKLQLPLRLTKLATLTPLSFPPSTATPSPHPPTTSLLSTIHLRALEALNNLFLTFAAAQLSEPGDGRFDSQALWDGLLPVAEMIASEAAVLSARGQEMRGEVLDMVTGCLWGVVKLESTPITVDAKQIQLLFDLLPILRKDDAKSRTIDTLALVAARSNATEAENKMIGDFLISALNASAPSALTPELLVSVVNAIIDIYADETRSYDVNFVQNNYLKSLSSQVNRVRNDVKKIDRRKDREARTRGEETYENLVAFIKYRRALGR